ncbi:carbohydrate-binding domain-containing protein [Coriobacteriales bacterium OH1046]|nr:carbohydrate-binding domain-containing protein [Coriobacteriales bacterium OH1046]
MKRSNLTGCALSAGLALVLAAVPLAGCMQGGEIDAGTPPATSVAEAADDGTTGTVENGGSVSFAIEKGPGYVDAVEAEDAFSAGDLDWGYDPAAATAIALTGSGAEIQGSGAVVDGSTITISAGGTYIISGSLADGTIVVDVLDTEKVRLVLDGASIDNSSGAAIYVAHADKVFITLADGTVSSLSTTGADGTGIDGAIFSKDDLTINGTGTLEVSCTAGHGIVGKDDLTIVAATIDVSASGHAIQANDSVGIAEAVLSLSAGADGIHAANDEDVEEGWVYIVSGTVSISSADDGIDASSAVQIDGGSIAISADDDGVHTDRSLVQNDGAVTVEKSGEAYEGMTITVTGGTADLAASDDGLNATSGSSGSMIGWGMEYDSSARILITGGIIYLDALGDGIDSNGDFTMTGGEAYISGPTDDGNGTLDYAGTSTITGGTIIAAGSAGMVQSITAGGAQGVIMASATGESGTAISLEDADGTVLASYAPPKGFDSIVISAPGIEQGGTYTLRVGSSSRGITMDGLNYGGMGGMMGGGPR